VSINNSPTVDELLKRIMQAKRFSKYREVANYLGEDSATISAWKQRNSDVYDKIINRCRGEINECWLLTGEGPMLSTPEEPVTAMGWRPRPGSAKLEEPKQELPPAPRLITMASRVLESGSVHGQALSFSIVSGHTALEKEDELEMMKKKIDSIEGMMKILLERSEKEEVPEAQKRDKAA